LATWIRKMVTFKLNQGHILFWTKKCLRRVLESRNDNLEQVGTTRKCRTCPVLVWSQHILWFSQVGSSGVPTQVGSFGSRKSRQSSGVPMPRSFIDIVSIGAVRPILDVSGIDTERVRYSPMAT